MMVVSWKFGYLLMRVVPDGNFWNVEAKRYEMPLKVSWTAPWWYSKRLFGRWTGWLCRPRWLKWSSTHLMMYEFVSEGEGSVVRFDSREEAVEKMEAIGRSWTK